MKVIMKIEIPDELVETIIEEYKSASAGEKPDKKLEAEIEKRIDSITTKMGLRIRTDLRLKFFSLITAASKKDKK